MKSWVKYTLYGAGLIALFFIVKAIFGSSFSFQDDAELDEESIQAGLDNIAGINASAELEDDDSATMFTVENEDVLTADMASAITDHYQDKVEAMAAKIDVPLDEMLATVASIMINNMSTGDVVTLKAVELYLDHLDIWLPLFMNATDKVFDKVGDLGASLLDANTSATTCVQTTFVKDVTSEVTNTNSQTVTSVAITRSKGGFLGMNKRKNTKETSIVENFATSNEVRHVAYLPHCTGWGISQSNFLANMSAFTLGLSATYSFFQVILDACPDINVYVNRSNSNKD